MTGLTEEELKLFELLKMKMKRALGGQVDSESKTKPVTEHIPQPQRMGEPEQKPNQLDDPHTCGEPSEAPREHEQLEVRDCSTGKPAKGQDVDDATSSSQHVREKQTSEKRNARPCAQAPLYATPRSEPYVDEIFT